MSSMLVHKGTHSCLWVYETLDPNYTGEQPFTVINGAWDGVYCRGIIECIRTGSISEVELYNDFNRECNADSDSDAMLDYNTVITRFIDEVLK